MTTNTTTQTTRRIDALVEQAKTLRDEYAVLAKLRDDGTPTDIVANQKQRVTEALSQISYTFDAINTSI